MAIYPGSDLAESIRSGTGLVSIVYSGTDIVHGDATYTSADPIQFGADFSQWSNVYLRGAEIGNNTNTDESDGIKLLCNTSDYEGAGFIADANITTAYAGMPFTVSIHMIGATTSNGPGELFASMENNGATYPASPTAVNHTGLTQFVVTPASFEDVKVLVYMDDYMSQNDYFHLEKVTVQAGDWT
jgi:hypothetical protein